MWHDSVQRTGPLAGLKVLDFSRILAGPYATMQLADLGANVVKVEAPGRGDETRHWGPPFAPDGNASYFHAVNHGKRSVALDLQRVEDLELAQALAEEANVVVDNFLPGRMARFGLDHTALAVKNSALITATISGFGKGNAYSERPGFDFLAQAMGGLMSITGQPGGEPTRVGVAVNDLLAGSLLCSGVLAALSAVRAGAEGRHVEVSLLDTQISMLANIASGWLIGQTAPDRFGNAHPSIAPYETLQTQDGEIAVAVGTDRQFSGFSEALGMAELADDKRFRTNAARISNRQALVSELESALMQRTTGEWMSSLVDAGVPVAPVNTVEEAFSDPVVQERMVIDPGGCPQVRTPIWLDDEPLPVDVAPPVLGADTEQFRARLQSRNFGQYVPASDPIPVQGA